MVSPNVIDGNLLDQPVEVIVNAWNRNIIPWWLLVPQGVSGAIKKRGGYRPFIELGRLGPIPLGGAVMTSAGRLPCKAIIHVAGISMLWRSSRESIQGSVASAMDLVNRHGFGSVAFPVIGAGTGGYRQADALALMLEAFSRVTSPAAVTVVRYRGQSMNPPALP
ncbi:MAG: macro domain-containing protein [Sulfuritalea sp.]|jgi:O-acetyl-ADP-ribose deacetylase (regulator of RNase III)|nr:macro domain-containing protein [Sulfuritalea sp.]